MNKIKAWYARFVYLYGNDGDFNHVVNVFIAAIVLFISAIMPI